MIWLWLSLGTFSPLMASERSETHIFGDSIFTTSNRRIHARLQELSSKTIADHSVGGATMSQIKDQYLRERQAPIATVIMDGGGNDILGQRGVCQNQLPDACKAAIHRVANTLTETLELMARDGVSEVVLLSCHYPMGWNAGFDQAVDYAFPLLSDICAQSPVPCRLVDPRSTFRNRNDLFEWDGVHPNWNGSTLMADLLWQALQAQTE